MTNIVCLFDTEIAIVFLFDTDTDSVLCLILKWPLTLTMRSKIVHLFNTDIDIVCLFDTNIDTDSDIV